MPADKVELLDSVALREDAPALGLRAGEVGAVVDILAEGVYEVEFVDPTGQTYGMHALKREQLMRLHQKGEALRSPAKVA